MVNDRDSNVKCNEADARQAPPWDTMPKMRGVSIFHGLQVQFFFDFVGQWV
ncbi:MAG: hypothetical protein QMD09_04245 [Desulfatibacillaceae bacterium]|nr:hypothetical protein [Desulfatibacillaceae bacterium]